MSHFFLATLDLANHFRSGSVHRAFKFGNYWGFHLPFRAHINVLGLLAERAPVFWSPHLSLISSLFCTCWAAAWRSLPKPGSLPLADVPLRSPHIPGTLCSEARDSCPLPGLGWCSQDVILDFLIFCAQWSLRQVDPKENGPSVAAPPLNLRKRGAMLYGTHKPCTHAAHTVCKRTPGHSGCGPWR